MIKHALRMMRTFAPALVVVLATAAPSSAQRSKVEIRPVVVCYDATRGQPFKSPNGIFYHKKRQEIYVADSGSHRIVIFDMKGAPIGGFLHMVDGRDDKSRVEGEPRGVAVNSRGDIFVTDNLARYVDLLDYRGRSIQRVYPADFLNLPRDKVTGVQLAVDQEDNLFIAVSGEESCVLVLDKTFKLKRKIGKKGAEKGQFDSPSGVWIDDAGKIYVTDALGIAVQVFDKDGSLLLSFGDRGFGPMSFGLPTGCVTDKQGNIWVLDGVQCKLAAFDSKGGWVNNLSGQGNAPGDVLFPTYISGDGVDTLFVSERVGKRIQVLKIRFNDDKAAVKTATN